MNYNCTGFLVSNVVVLFIVLKSLYPYKLGSSARHFSIYTIFIKICTLIAYKNKF